MHNASTKQRLAALRRKLGIFTGWQPRWVKQRAKRLAAQRAQDDAVALAAAAEAPTELVARSSGAAGTEVSPPSNALETPLSASSLALKTPLSPWQRQGERARERGPASGEVDARTEPVVAPATIVPAPPTSPPPEPATAPAPAAIPPGVLARAPDSTPASRRRARTAATVALAAAVLALLAVLALRSPAVPTPRPVGPEGAARAPERDARASVAVASTPPEAAPRPVAGLDSSTLEVRRGDTLWHLASVHLGDPFRWPELHAANASQIGNPDLIFPGQRLRVPAAGGAPL